MPSRRRSACCGSARRRRWNSSTPCATTPSAASTWKTGRCCGPCWWTWPMAASACCWRFITWWWTVFRGVFCWTICNSSTANCRPVRRSRYRPKPALMGNGPRTCTGISMASWTASITGAPRAMRQRATACRVITPSGCWRPVTSARSRCAWTPNRPVNCCSRRRRPIAPRSTTCC
ncbi:hypothetical protein PFLU4_58100 [Pseudomonas fluorescens]|nr:hypothetical protein PFLU4_58100 [Pseudomonas fluorescens]